MRSLKLGLRGPDVMRWQQFLEIHADGIFGPKTRAATEVFQRKHELAADGVVGQKTYATAAALGLQMIRRLRNAELTADIIEQSKRILRDNVNSRFGTEVPFDSGDRHLVARIEEHYHPPGGPRRPWGPHTGVSVFVLEGSVAPDAIEDDGLTGAGETLDLPPGNADLPAFRLSARSRARLEGVHPDLVRIVEHAITVTPIDFTVLEGLRSLERQRMLVARGSSRTLKSRQLTGHAADLAPLDGADVSWDWPLSHRLAVVIKAAAEDVDVPLEWGGDWTSFKDGPHWQLPRDRYPG